MKLPKLILTDIDGVWTDGGMYYDETGNEFKKFNTYDSAGVLFCKLLNIPVGIITGESTVSAKNRAEKLKMDYFFSGIKNKINVVNKLCDELGIDISEVAYLGDDINDYDLLKIVGFSAAPYSAPKYVSCEVDLILSKKGGEGVFREFVEEILDRSGIDIVFLLKEKGRLISETNIQ